jgi:DNA-binding transcriptional ArsR family regulator
MSSTKKRTCILATLFREINNRDDRSPRIPSEARVGAPGANDASRKSLALYYTFWCNVVMYQLTDVLIAISHPSRRAIIQQLAAGPARFTDIAEPFDTALNAVTKHLKLLERARLIERKKVGREVFITFRGEPLREVAGWLHEYERFWNERLDQFEQHFKKQKEKQEKEKKK